MIYLYLAENRGKENFVKNVLLRHTAAPIDILRNENGKPYLKDNPVYFNLTHSGNFCAIAVSRRPVGVDMEIFGKGIRSAVLSSFGNAEQAEIKSEKEFLMHWTARESYVKFCGNSLAHMLKRMEFTGSKLYYNNEPVTPCPRFYFLKESVIAVCGEGEIEIIDESAVL